MAAWNSKKVEALRGWELIFQSRTDVSSACAPFSLPFNFFDPSRRKETFLAQSIGRLRKCQMRCIERRNDKLSYNKRQNELYVLRVGATQLGTKTSPFFQLLPGLCRQRGRPLRRGQRRRRQQRAPLGGVRRLNRLRSKKVLHRQRRRQGGLLQG